MSQKRTYSYLVRAKSQKVNEAVNIRHHGRKYAITEFKRRFPEFQGEDIICRLFTPTDRMSAQMDEELQGHY